MKQSNKRTIIFVICSLLLLIGGLTLAIRLGSVHITFKDIWNSIFNYNETLELMLVRDVRIPRALAVLFTGGILGVTGAMIQGVTRNPIAVPAKSIFAIELLFAFFDINPKTIIPVINAPIKEAIITFRVVIPIPAA